MRDGKTRRRKVEDTVARGAHGWSATLVEVQGGAEGNEYPLVGERIVIGRGPDVDLAFEDGEMSAKYVGPFFPSTLFTGFPTAAPASDSSKRSLTQVNSSS